jgi:hypothetical protein
MPSPTCPTCGLPQIPRRGRPGVLVCVQGHGLPLTPAPRRQEDSSRDSGDLASSLMPGYPEQISASLSSRRFPRLPNLDAQESN